MMNCNVCMSANDKRNDRKSMCLNQFDKQTIASIDAKEMDAIIKEIYSNNYGIGKNVSGDQKVDEIEKKRKVKCAENKSDDNPIKITGKKRKIQNQTKPAKKRQKVIGSTFDLMS